MGVGVDIPASELFFKTQADQTASRALGSAYQNAQGRPMLVAFSVTFNNLASDVIAYSDASNPPTTEIAEGSLVQSGNEVTLTFMVVTGNYYKVSAANGAVNKVVEWY